MNASPSMTEDLKHELDLIVSLVSVASMALDALGDDRPLSIKDTLDIAVERLEKLMGQPWARRS